MLESKKGEQGARSALRRKNEKPSSRSTHQEETNLDIIFLQLLRSLLGSPIRHRLLSLILLSILRDPFDDPSEFSPSVASSGGSSDESSEEKREEHEMVILNPDHVSLSDLGENDLSEGEVDGSVGEPVRLVEVHLSCLRGKGRE